MQFPEYTVSLLIWLLPDLAVGIFVFKKHLLSVEKVYAFLLTVGVMAAVHGDPCNACPLERLSSEYGGNRLAVDAVPLPAMGEEVR